MDFFALPDVFLRKVMRTIKLKDRMQIRLTCRAFEQLVADSHAGFFESGRIFSYLVDGQKKNISNIGSTQFLDIDTTEDRAKRFVCLRNRLFSVINFDNFVIKCSCDNFKLEFLSKLTERFIIGVLSMDAFTEETLKNSLQLMTKFSTSKHNLNLYFIPESEKFLSIPPMDELIICARSEELTPIRVEVFLKLIEIHKSIYLKRVTMVPDELTRAIKVGFTQISNRFKKYLRLNISADNRKRSVQWYAHPPTIVMWLNNCGITEDSEAGESHSEFLLTRTVNDGGSMHLRLPKWMILFDGFSWTGEGYSTVVTVTNEHDEFAN